MTTVTASPPKSTWMSEDSAFEIQLADFSPDHAGKMKDVTSNNSTLENQRHWHSWFKLTLLTTHTM